MCGCEPEDPRRCRNRGDRAACICDCHDAWEDEQVRKAKAEPSPPAPPRSEQMSLTEAIDKARPTIPPPHTRIRFAGPPRSEPSDRTPQETAREIAHHAYYEIPSGPDIPLQEALANEIAAALRAERENTVKEVHALLREWADDRHMNFTGLNSCDDLIFYCQRNGLLPIPLSVSPTPADKGVGRPGKEHPGCDYYAEIACNKCGWIDPAPGAESGRENG